MVVVVERDEIPNIEITGDDFIVLNHPEVKALRHREVNKLGTREWRKRNKTKHNLYQREYRLNHKEQCRAYHKKFYLSHPERKNWYQNWTAEQREENKNKKQSVKVECLHAYSDNRCVCVCCGEKQIDFLTIDHTNNDGHLDKGINAKKRMGGNYLYGYLKKRGFPNKDKYQVLCWNCNCGKGINGGVCPHKSVNA